MAVRLRLKRLGRIHRPFYRIAAFDSRTARDGRCLEELGTYDPQNKNEDQQVTLKADRIVHWLEQGALPTETVASILKRMNVSRDAEVEKPAPEAEPTG